jgi:hypothetical protein
MGKKNSKKMIKEIYDCSVCACDCTGLLQKISVDPEEVERFHREYIKDDK